MRSLFFSRFSHPLSLQRNLHRILFLFRRKTLEAVKIMEDYLLCMKAFRSHMNEVEDQAAKVSVDEQMRITTVQTLEKDLDLAYSDIKRIKVETDQLVKAKGRICSHILEKKRTLSSLESDSSMLSQTLELVQQERDSLSAKLVEKSTYYTNTEEDISAKLRDQQMMSKNSQGTEGTGGKCSIESHLSIENVGDRLTNLETKLHSAKSNLDLVKQTKLSLVSENSKVKQSIELLKCRISDHMPELQGMNLKTLEEEHQALLSDRAGETEYFLSLQLQFEKLKGISCMVKCACGKEYKVEEIAVYD